MLNKYNPYDYDSQVKVGGIGDIFRCCICGKKRSWWRVKKVMQDDIDDCQVCCMEHDPFEVEVWKAAKGKQDVRVKRV